MKHASLPALTLWLLLVTGTAFAEATAAPAASPPAAAPAAPLFPADDLACAAPSANAPFFGDPTKPIPLTCSAEATCWGGQVVSCTGTTCDSGCWGVQCDSVITNCSACDAPSFCTTALEITGYCTCRSCGGTDRYCRCCWCVLDGENCQICGNPF